MFLILCNFIHRLLRKKLWSQRVWLWSGCRSSGSFPVKPEASAHLGLTSLLYHRFQDPSVNTQPILLCHLLQIKGEKREKEEVHQVDLALCVAFEFGLWYPNFWLLKKQDIMLNIIITFYMERSKHRVRIVCLNWVVNRKKINKTNETCCNNRRHLHCNNRTEFGKCWAWLTSESVCAWVRTK